MVGVGGNAGDHVGVARLHGARGAAQPDDAAGAAERHVVEKARAQAEMLGQADRRVRPDREGRNGKAVDVGGLQPRLFAQRPQRTPDPPVRGMDRIALVGDGHWRGGDDALVVLPGSAHAVRFFIARRSWQAPASMRSCASALSAPRWIFCVPVSGIDDTNDTQPGAL